MLKRKIIVSMCILIISLSALPLTAQQGEDRVRDELNTLLNELGRVKMEPDPKPNPFVDFLSDILISIFSFIYRLLNSGSILVIPLIILLVFLISYIGLKFFSRFRKERDKSAQMYSTDKEMQGEITGRALSHYIKDSEELAKNGKFGEALVLLHKASIVSLRIKKILLAGEYHTNNEILKGLLNKSEYYEPFSNLAQVAELFTFRSEAISRDVYKKLFEVYRKNFT